MPEVSLRMSWFTKLFVVMIFVGTYLVHTPGLLDEFLIGRFLWLNIIGLIAIFFLLSRLKEVKLNALDFTIILFYIISIISLSWAKVPSAGFLTAQSALIFLFYYFVFRYLIPRIPENFFRNIFLLLLCVVLGIGFYQLISTGLSEGISGKVIYQVIGLSGHKNILSSYLVLLLGINLWYLPTDRGRYASYFVLILTGLFIFLLRARTSLIALTILLLFFSLRIRRFDLNKWKSLLKGFVALFVSIGLTIYVLTTKLGGSLMDFSRLNPLNFTKDASLIERIVIWYKSWLIIKQNWLIGLGLGNWKIEFPSQSFSGIYMLQSRDMMATRVHNDFVETWAELGIIGFVTFTLLFILPLIYIVAEKSITKPSKFKSIFTGLLVCYGIFSFFEFPKERLELLIIWAFLLAMINIHSQLLSNKRNSCKISKNSLRFGVYLIIPLMIFNLFLGYQIAKGEFHTVKTLQAQLSSQWPIVERESHLAYSKFYQIIPMAIAVKWYEGLAQYHQEKFQEAKASFELALKHTPYFLRLLNDYAACLVQEEDFERARDLYLRVMYINPRFEEGMFNLSYVYAQLGDFPRAAEWVEKTTGNPQKKEEFLQEIKRLQDQVD